MGTSYASVVVPASAEDTWSVVRDFDGLPAWHPAISSSVIEQGRLSAEVGCVRHLVLTDGGFVREQLRSLDDERRVLVYSFVESPFPVRSYLATLRVRPITVPKPGAFVEWFAHYEADAADEADLEQTFRAGVFETGLEALSGHLA